MKRLVSSLQKVKRFFFYSANLTDCFFAAESEEIVSLLQKVKRLDSLLQKVKMVFFFCSANLTDCFFAAESEEIGFFTAESEDILFLQCQFNRLFLLLAK